MTTATRNPLLHNATRDALTLKMRGPLLTMEPGPDGLLVPARDAAGRARTLRPSREAVLLSKLHLGELASHYFRHAAGRMIAAAFHARPQNQRATIFCASRLEVSRWWPNLPAGSGVSLSGTATGDLPGLLIDALDKAVLGHHALARRAWRAVASEGSVESFHPARRVDLADLQLLEALPAGASARVVGLNERTAETVTAVTRSLTISITRQTIVNDDLDAIGTQAEALGVSAARSEDNAVFSTLTANAYTADGNALFSTAHGNLTTGALSVTSLGAVVKALAAREDNNGYPLDFAAQTLLVPSAIKTVAAQLLGSTAMSKLHEVEQPIELASTGWLDPDSTTQWYLIGPHKPVEIAFVNGQAAPTISQRVHFDSKGMEVNATHDFGVSAVDHRCIVRSSGS